MGTEQVQPLQVRVDLGVMTMKEYITVLRSPELDRLHQMQFRVIPKILPLGFSIYREIQSVYSISDCTSFVPFVIQ